MVNAYSLDLREKVFDAYILGEGSKQEIADRFKVSHDFVDDLVKLHAQTGSLKTRYRGDSRKPSLNESSLNFILKTVKNNNDYTLSELCRLLEIETSVKVGTTVMFRALRKLGLTLKKNHGQHQKEQKKK